ncbi:MAG: hypothetical protein EA384_11385 [Spirochaetaceae bacterium]|nr:MAG: hypothetical protein EA384_11385 [Spirochaetaceae bacterium]
MHFLLSWKHSGFSIDNSVRILDQSAQESLAAYIARPPISLKKIRYEPFKGKVLFHTKYSDYFKQNMHLFDALDFLAEFTQHIPPKRLQLIRRYGLYASRTKGRWDEMLWVAERAPDGWKASHSTVSGTDDAGYESLSESEEKVEINARKRAWARLGHEGHRGHPGPGRDTRHSGPSRQDRPRAAGFRSDATELTPWNFHPTCRLPQVRPHSGVEVLKPDEMGCDNGPRPASARPRRRANVIQVPDDTFGARLLQKRLHRRDNSSAMFSCQAASRSLSRSSNVF